MFSWLKRQNWKNRVNEKCRNSLIFGLNASQYQRDYREYIDKARPADCPFCDGNCRFHFHGTYPRNVYDVTEGDPRIKILRYKSPNHKSTVSILPEFLTPRKRYSLRVISLVLYLHFALARDLKHIHKMQMETSYSTMLEWRRHWKFNAINLLQTGFPAAGIPVDFSGSYYVNGNFEKEAFSACVRYIGGPDGTAVECDGRDGVDMERIIQRGRSVLPRIQLSLQRFFPQLWLFRER